MSASNNAHSSGRNRRLLRSFEPYLLLLPALLIVLAFFAYPLIKAIQLAFMHYVLFDPSHEPIAMMVKITANSFTVKERVCSWICVAACMTATKRPMNILIRIGGPDRIKISRSA